MLKKYKIKVNGNEYEVEVEEIKENNVNKANNNTPVKRSEEVKTSNVKTDVKESKKNVKESKKSTSVPSGATTINAPMPGTVLRVDVSEGDLVDNGQVLMILEAMKMENEITSVKNGKVASINVQKGDSVNAGEILISVE
ncbi:MAG: biotin/lipoyl-containing protein [Clostridiales bacterium]